jgi:non-homologous end joining protein Ku
MGPPPLSGPYTDQVKELIEQRARGRHVAAEEAPAEEAEVLDLVAALEASLKGASKGGRASRRPSTKANASKRKTQSRKSA